jgi:flavorubredoxin
MSKVLVVYATRSGETKAIAALIAEGIRFAGAEAKCIDIAGIKKETDLAGYDGYAFGAATYHGEMMQTMKTMLFLAQKVNLEGKAGGAFGAFGWSGEAPGRIYDTMKNVFKMDMLSDPLMLKSASLGGGARMAQDYGKKLGEKLCLHQNTAPDLPN